MTPAPLDISAHGARNSCRNGFSLVEVLVTLGLISILASLAAPHLSAHAHRLVLRSEASAMRLFLERCAAYALSAQAPVEVALAKDSLTARHPGGAALGGHTLQHGATLEPLSQGESSLLFYPSISASPATMVLTRGGISCSIILSLRGRVRFVC